MKRVRRNGKADSFLQNLHKSYWISNFVMLHWNYIAGAVLKYEYVRRWNRF